MKINKLSKNGIIHLSSAKTLRGGERQCILLHNELCKKGFTSYIFCRSGSELSRQPAKNCIQYKYSSPIDIAGLFSIYKKVKLASASIIHCHDSKAFTLGNIIKTLLPDIKIVYSRKVLFPIKNTRFNRWKFSRCSHIIAVSSAVAQTCKKIAPKTPVSIIPDAAIPDMKLLSHDEARIRLGLAQNDICIGSVAFFTKEKNLDILIKCADYFCKVNQSIKFALIGPVEKDMEPILKQKKSIITTGYVPEAVLFYNAFDIYLSTSKSEGLGSALLDAIVRDIPSIALDAGGTSDLFGKFGFPAKNFDEILKQLSMTCADYSSAQVRAAEHGMWARTVFKPEALITNHIKIYSALC